MAQPVRVIIMGAAGRDFHDFNVCFRSDPTFRVVAFTATQIPDIAGRRYPAALAGPLYPEGIPIYAESELERLIREEKVDQVVFAYSDVSHAYVMHQASVVMAAGADFRLIGPNSAQVRSSLPVVAVCAVRTGVGKSPTTRRVAEVLKAAGVKTAVIRHPMPYGDLAAQAVQRFATMADLDLHCCTIEEREEYAPHIERGNVVFAGVDYERILREAEKEAEVILWDGGNNDFPFYRPDLHLTLVDPHRPGHELSYFPGEVNLRAAHVVIINKADSAPPGAVARLEATVRTANPTATLIVADCPYVVDADAIRGKRVLVVEDGPTLTHGEMGYGAGYLAAKRYGAEIIDPRPFAVGSIRGVFEKWTHIKELLPAMGYSQVQRAELLETIERADPEVVLVATPVDLAAILDLERRSVRLSYDVRERGEPTMEEILAPIVARARATVSEPLGTK
jgi:predicted GTPase